jgi:hypothetical protein
VAAITVRLADRDVTAGARAAAAAALVAGVLGLGIWLPSGPLAKGWAAKAGTPAALLGGGHHVATTKARTP